MNRRIRTTNLLPNQLRSLLTPFILPISTITVPINSPQRLQNLRVRTVIVGINVIAFAAMGIDKAKARAGKWRIAESTLFALAALGGALGGTLGMRVFHHKTKHK